MGLLKFQLAFVDPHSSSTRIDPQGKDGGQRFPGPQKLRLQGALRSDFNGGWALDSSALPSDLSHIHDLEKQPQLSKFITLVTQAPTFAQGLVDGFVARFHRATLAALPPGVASSGRLVHSTFSLSGRA